MNLLSRRATGLLAATVMCMTATLANAVDTDGDGVDDSVDNCSAVANPAQRDTDGDGFGNFCDADLNNDQIVNAVDLGLFRAVFFSTDADADFNGDGIVNTGDLGRLRIGFFLPPGPGAVAPQVTWTNDIAPLFTRLCAPCHTVIGSGGHNIATSYADSFLPAGSQQCAGLTVGACTIVRIQLGQMPQGRGCTGDPVIDEGDDDCLTQNEQNAVQAWIDQGLPE